MDEFFEGCRTFFLTCLAIFVAICWIIMIAQGQCSSSYDRTSRKSSKSVEKSTQNWRDTRPPYSLSNRPSYPVLQSQPVYEQSSRSSGFSPDDAYDEGYDEGYEQGLEDGKKGRSHGYNYDDSSPYYNYYETRYREGYDEGYDDGYRKGHNVYEDEQEKILEEGLQYDDDDY